MIKNPASKSVRWLTASGLEGEEGWLTRHTEVRERRKWKVVEVTQVRRVGSNQQDTLSLSPSSPFVPPRSRWNSSPGQRACDPPLLPSAAPLIVCQTLAICPLVSLALLRKVDLVKFHNALELSPLLCVPSAPATICYCSAVQPPTRRMFFQLPTNRLPRLGGHGGGFYFKERPSSFKHCVSLCRAAHPLPHLGRLLKLLMLSGDALADTRWTDMKRHSYLQGFPRLRSARTVSVGYCFRIMVFPFPALRRKRFKLDQHGPAVMNQF